jgi:hypothetical protein
MKSIDLRYKRTVSQTATVVVEVPDEVSEEEAARLLTSEQINLATQGQWNDEEPVVEEPPHLEDSLTQADEDKGHPHYRLGESGVFERA